MSLASSISSTISGLAPNRICGRSCGFPRSPRPSLRYLIAALLALGTALAGIGSADAAGTLVISGNGAERPMIEALVEVFEKTQSSVYVDVLWDGNINPADHVRQGQAQLAVSGSSAPDLRATQLAWDGIGVVVHLSNNTKDLTLQHIGDIFSGKHESWSELGGPDTKILLIDRPKDEHVRAAFESRLGIVGKIPSGLKVIAQDEKVLKTVVGTLPPNSAVAFLSLEQALAAVHSGVAVRLLSVDKVEPEEPTVKDGRYKLRRPVLLLSAQEPSPAVKAFEEFCFSPAGQKIIDEFYTPLAPQPKP